MLPASFLDEVRARTILTSLIARTVKLERAGKEKRGCCPFHDEKTPSFYVNDDKGFYHCFGCSAHGDAIRFLTEAQGMPFIDAVRELATAAGLDMPARDAQTEQRDRERDGAREIMQRAAMWFRNQLVSDRGAAVRDYLTGRGITGLTTDEFVIGYAPRGNRNAPPLFYAFADVPVETLKTLGLVGLSEDRHEYYDFFRERVMIPIHDARGRVIAFGGRTLRQGATQRKYLNSPDTPLFDKGRTLFNMHRAAAPARKGGRLLIVEGYMDVIALHRSGVPEAVAPNGTALTAAQLELAWSVTPHPTACFDGDAAGARAAVRAANAALPLLAAGRSLSFIRLPTGKDPDDIAREGGPDAVKAALDKVLSLADVLWQHHSGEVRIDTPDGKAELGKRLRDAIRQIGDATVRQAYDGDLRERWERLVAPAARSPAAREQRERRLSPSRAVAEIRRTGVGSMMERAVLRGLMRFPDMIRDDLLLLGDDDCLALYRAMMDLLFEQPALIRAPDALEAELNARGYAERVLAIRRGATLPMSYTFDSTPPAEARADLEAALFAIPCR